MLRNFWKCLGFFSVALLLQACVSDTNSDLSNDMVDMRSRPVTFRDYPQAETTYLSFSHSHGFQVNYLGANGRSWLWYPENTRGVAETWRVDVSKRAVCWGHPANSYNPVTGKSGGGESCELLSIGRRVTISKLDGDPFGLANGTVPYRREKCTAPTQFDFDRQRYRCD